MTQKTHTINATNKSLGRLAVEVALLLRGKNKPDFVPYRDQGDFVKVENTDKIKITGRKIKDKIYIHHTGFPGGFRQATMEELVAKKGMAEVLRRAVYGMLPKNKLRDRMMKRLIIN